MHSNVIRNIVLAIALVLCATLQCVQSYKAVVVEYKSIPDGANTVLKNIDNYVQHVDQSSRDVDIIVFPEYGLTTLEVFEKPNWKEEYTLQAPKSYEGIDLCSTTEVEKALRDISCVAQRKEIYVVINFIEKDNSTTQDIFYNTNLVFDKLGKIVAKYRKINLYEENELTPGNEIVTFTTTFGVKFGIFTCYDILFKYPALEILDKDVYDIIYPTAWISQTPFGISLSVQAGYAKKNKVNLLASNYNNPPKANGGSGIYRGTGAIKTQISGQYTSFIVELAAINPAPGPGDKTCGASPDFGDVDGRAAGKVPTIENYVTRKTEGYSSSYKDLTLGDTEFKAEICDGSLCCKFEATTIAALATGNGIYKWSLSQKDGAVSCALVFCKTNEDSSCGERIDKNTINTIFTKISVKGNFRKEQYTLPITSTAILNPIYKYSYCAKGTSDSTNEDISMEINENASDLTAFGIVGFRSSAAVALWGNTIVVLLLGLYALFRNYI